METYMPKRRHDYAKPLETFLSGMETRISSWSCKPGGYLETFLSGMETVFHDAGELLKLAALKPSLVEWKRRRGGGVFCLSQALETFFSGMETAISGLSSIFICQT